jgi:hypothetical protein
MSSSESESGADMEEKGFVWGDFIRYCGKMVKGDSRGPGSETSSYVVLL